MQFGPNHALQVAKQLSDSCLLAATETKYISSLIEMELLLQLLQREPFGHNVPGLTGLLRIPGAGYLQYYFLREKISGKDITTDTLIIPYSGKSVKNIMEFTRDSIPTHGISPDIIMVTERQIVGVTNKVRSFKAIKGFQRSSTNELVEKPIWFVTNTRQLEHKNYNIGMDIIPSDPWLAINALISLASDNEPLVKEWTKLAERKWRKIKNGYVVEDTIGFRYRVGLIKEKILFDDVSGIITDFEALLQMITQD